jgi:hypothetical protein
MKRIALVFFVLAMASSVRSQSAPETAKAATPGNQGTADSVAATSAPTGSSTPLAAVSPTPAPAAGAPSDRPRLLSNETAAKISTNGPKYNPPPPAPVDAEELPDLRDIDRPRNQIIRLPKVMVQEPKAPRIKDAELLTPQGKLELAYKNNPGLHLLNGVPLLGNNSGIALFMLEEQRRLERKAEMEDLVSIYLLTDPKTAKTLKKQTDEVFVRDRH